MVAGGARAVGNLRPSSKMEPGRKGQDRQEYKAAERARLLGSGCYMIPWKENRKTIGSAGIRYSL